MDARQRNVFSVKLDKATALTLLTIVAALLLLSQPPTTPAADDVIDWTSQFGTSSGDQATGSSTDPAGNVYVVGQTGDALPGGGGSSGGPDAYIRKFDALGNIVWTRQFGTPFTDVAENSSTDASGNIYVVGRTGGELPGGGGSAGSHDAYIRKYDSSGNIVWTRQFGTLSTDHAHGASTDSSGNVYVAGETRGVLPGGGGLLGSADAYLRKYDASGNVIWTRQFGTSDYDNANWASTDSGGSVYVVGRSDDALPGGAGSLGLSDAYIRKYDDSGNIVWTRQFGTSSYDWAWTSATDSSGDVYVVGDTFGVLPGGGGTAGGYDAYIRKYDASGNIVWTRQFGTSATDFALGTSLDAGGNVYVAGRTGGTLPGGGGAFGGDDAYVRKYNASGSAVWTRQFGTTDFEYAWGTSTDASGNVYVVGRTFGALSGGGGSSGDYDAYALKFGTIPSVDLLLDIQVTGPNPVPSGGVLEYTVWLDNREGARPVNFQAQSYLTGPLEKDPLVGPVPLTLGAGEMVSRTLYQTVPPWVPLGTYNMCAKAFDGLVTFDSECAVFEIAP